MPIKYHSQPATRQDEWIVQKTGGYAGGFFVEIGAHNGVRHSNTKALEDHFGWTGLLVEPNPALFPLMKANRPRCKHAQDQSNTVPFVVGREKGDSFSGILQHMPSDFYERHCRHKSKIEHYSTISLRTLLKQYGAPKQIDYISLDVEGAEFAILDQFIFTCPTTDIHISYLTIEFRYDRLLLHDLERLLEPTHVLDEVRAFDACFVNRRLI